MVFDFDDAYPGHDKLDRLHELKELRPDFKVTLFAIPGLCTPEWCDTLPGWIELAVHGWQHGTVTECANWSEDQMAWCLDQEIVEMFFVEGFKAPGWQISDGCYRELAHRGWWVADQHLEDERRPPELRTYFYEDGNWHGHVQDVCNNGVEESWPQLVDAVKNAPSFEFVSEVV